MSQQNEQQKIEINLVDAINNVASAARKAPLTADEHEANKLYLQALAELVGAFIKGKEQAAKAESDAQAASEAASKAESDKALAAAPAASETAN